MMLKILLCCLFLEGLLSYKIDNGINIRNSRSTTDLLKVDRYLRKYGYLTESTVLASKEERMEALKRFQFFVKIPITGEVDHKTIEVMNLPRCGCADVMRKDDSQHTKKSKENIPKPVQFNLGTKWPRNTISWRLNSFSRRISQRQVIGETRRAFDLWSKAANLRFEERSSGNADIVIDFATGEHGDGSGNAFDGPGRVLAHAFFPTFGDTHFDDGERWVVNRTGTDYFTVAAHEFGHALGLGHSDIREALMAPFYTGYNPNFKLNRDDIAGIQALYGPPETERPRTTRAPLVTATPRTTTPVQPDEPETRPRSAICRFRFTAATRDLNGDLLAFVRGFYIIRMNTTGIVNVMTLRGRFGTFVPSWPNAAMSVLSESSVMLLRGPLLYTFTRNSRKRKRTFLRGSNSMPEPPTAAISISSNVATVFGTSQVWNMNPSTAEIYDNSYRYIQDAFPGVERIQLDSAVLQDDDTILFFSGKNVHTYDRQQRRVISVQDKADLLMPNLCAL